MSALVATLGDSISAQANPATWPERVRMRRGVSFIDRAVSGRTIAAVTGSTSNIMDTYASDLSGYTPNAIVVFAGTNDIYYGVTGADTLTRLWTLVAALKAAYPSARICVVQPLKRSGWLSDPTQSSIELAVYSAGVVSGAASNGCVLWTAGAQPSMQDTTNTVFFADGTHPTPFGAALLAADFWLGGTAAQLGMRPGGP